MMIYWSGVDVVWKLAVTVIAGLCVFIISNYLGKNSIDKEHIANKLDYKSAIWLIPLYMLIFCVLSYYGSFNGDKIKFH